MFCRIVLFLLLYTVSAHSSCIPNCEIDLCSPDTDLKCYHCIEGYFLNASNECGKCPSNCTSCRDDDYCVSCINWNFGLTCRDVCSPNCLFRKCFRTTGRCRIGCIDGYYGSRCSEHCSTTCIDSECSRIGTCSKGCIKGYHGYDCEYDCPKQCLDEECERNSGSCTKGCNEGYHGRRCDQTCSSECINQRFDEQTGSCIEGCIDGYVSNGNMCTRCSPETKCYSCRDGFFGDDCSKQCVNCKDHSCNSMSGRCAYGCVDGYFLEGDECKRCPESCVTCSSQDTCTACKPGFFGKECRDRCMHCKNDLCSITSGRCNECVNGYFIKDNECKKCPDSCRTCTSETLCRSCQPGYFGRYCSQTCSQRCIGRRCKKYSGSCLYGCVGNHYGSRCTSNCSKKCLDGVCSQYSGYCKKGCNDGYYFSGDDCVSCSHRNECYSCRLGYFGEHCANQCVQCKYTECDPISGRCLLGCVYGMFLEDDDECKTCPEPCLTCTSNMTCSTCKRGRFGRRCDEMCPNGCSDDECDATSGVCIKGCTKGNYGHRCDSKCSRKCLDGECESPTGYCTRGCIDGYFGRRCTWQCSDLCLNGRCNTRTGACSDGCIGGYKSNRSRCIAISFEDQASATTVSGAIVAIACAVGGLIVIIVVGIVLYRLIRVRNHQEHTNSRVYTDIVPANARTVSEVLNDVYQELDNTYEDVTPDIVDADAVQTADDSSERLRSDEAITGPVYENVSHSVK